MKYIDAVWEKNNLGVSAAEIVLETGDDIAEVDRVIGSCDKEYIVIKVVSYRSDISLYLQDKGFTYIEDQIELEHDLHFVERSKILQRLYDSLSYRIMNEEDIECLLMEIDNGMFDSDRISLDPFFEDGLSQKRYKNWIIDMLSKGAYSYLMSYKGEPAGFVILTTEDGDTYHSVLGGGYKKYRGTGLGIVNKEMEMVKNLGGKRVVTSVSSNNANQLKVLVSNGYVPKKVEHVFIKHN